MAIGQVKKATSIAEVNDVTSFTLPVRPNDPFYTDFSNVRGDYDETFILKYYNVREDNFLGLKEPRKLFLSGMRGSGKSTELHKLYNLLNGENKFFCIEGKIDLELDINDLEFTDILIYLLEKLLIEANTKGFYINTNWSKNVLSELNSWFANRTIEIKKSIKGELDIIPKDSILPDLIQKVTGLKVGLSGSVENASTIRRVLKNNFISFAEIFNKFVVDVNYHLVSDESGKYGKEVMFIVDGLEKIMTAELRKKIVIDESNRIKSINANLIFTLPIELMSERQYLSSFSTVKTFPVVKLINRNNSEIKEAIDKFKEFIYNRIDLSLFDSEKTVEKAIKMSGGSPRELLKIIQRASFESDSIIDMNALNKAIAELAKEQSRFLTTADISKLKELHKNTQKNIPYDDIEQKLLEQNIIFEYNDGSFKRVNPIIAESEIYRQNVLGG